MPCLRRARPLLPASFCQFPLHPTAQLVDYSPKKDPSQASLRCRVRLGLDEQQCPRRGISELTALRSLVDSSPPDLFEAEVPLREHLLSLAAERAHPRLSGVSNPRLESYETRWQGQRQLQQRARRLLRHVCRRGVDAIDRQAG